MSGVPSVSAIPMTLVGVFEPFVVVSDSVSSAGSGGAVTTAAMASLAVAMYLSWTCVVSEFLLLASVCTWLYSIRLDLPVWYVVWSVSATVAVMMTVESMIPLYDHRSFTIAVRAIKFDASGMANCAVVCTVGMTTGSVSRVASSSAPGVLLHVVVVTAVTLIGTVAVPTRVNHLAVAVVTIASAAASPVMDGDVAGEDSAAWSVVISSVVATVASGLHARWIWLFAARYLCFGRLWA